MISPYDRFFPLESLNGAISDLPDLPQEKLTFPKSTWYEKFSLRAPRSRLQGRLEEKKTPWQLYTEMFAL